MNLSNSITLTRIALSPFLLYFGYVLDKTTFLIIALLIMSTDLLDGYIARKLDHTTKFGYNMDSIADKIFAFFLVLTILIFYDFPILKLLMISFRDITFIVLLSLSVIIYGNTYSFPARNTGKMATLFQNISFVGILLNIPYINYLIALTFLIHLFTILDYVVFWNKVRKRF